MIELAFDEDDDDEENGNHDNISSNINNKADTTADANSTDVKNESGINSNMISDGDDINCKNDADSGDDQDESATKLGVVSQKSAATTTTDSSRQEQKPCW